MSRKPVFPPRVTRHSTGQARVRWRGKDHYLGAYGSLEAQEAYRRLLARLDAGGGPERPGHSPTVADVIAAALGWLTQDYPEGSDVPERHALAARPLLALYGTSAAADLDADKLYRVRYASASGSWMTEEEKAEYHRQRRPVGLCRSVVNKRLGQLRHLWDLAEARGLVPRGSCANLKTVKGVRKGARGVRHTEPRRAAERADVERVAPLCPPPVGTMLLLQFWSGMRSGEVRILRAGEVDRSDPTCWVYRQSRHKGDWREGTGELPRVVALGPESMALLGPWLEGRQPDDYVFSPPGPPGRCYTRRAYNKAVAAACQRAGVKLIPYQCRHAAKRRVTRELGLDAARAFLGQSSLSTTAEYDKAQDVETAKAAARKVG